MPKRTYLKIKETAEEIAHRIVHELEDHRFVRNEDGAVCVSCQRVFPRNTAAKQTIWNRWKTFTTHLEEQLRLAGWEKCGISEYRKKD